MKKVKKMFNIYGYDGGNYAGNVYNIDGIAPTITCVGGQPYADDTYRR